MQMLPFGDFAWLLYQYLCNGSTFVFDSEFPSTQPYWFCLTNKVQRNDAIHTSVAQTGCIHDVTNCRAGCAEGYRDFHTPIFFIRP